MTGTMVSRTPRSADGRVSHRVLEAVAEREGVSPLDLTRRLYEVVDPDALDALFADGKSPTVVRFTYNGYRVVVGAAGRVNLTPVAGSQD